MIGSFTDKQHLPTEAEVQEALGTALEGWKAMLSSIEDSFKGKRDYRFYGRNYGWALRFTRKGKSLVALYPAQNAFTVQIILDAQQTEMALATAIDPGLKQLIQQTPPIKEGRWLYIPYEARLLESIEKIIRIRAL